MTPLTPDPLPEHDVDALRARLDAVTLASALRLHGLTCDCPEWADRLEAEVARLRGIIDVAQALVEERGADPYVDDPIWPFELGPILAGLEQ